MKMENRINDILTAIVRKCFKIIRLTPNEKNVNAWVQFIKFGIVGVSNTVISYVLNILVLLAFKSTNVSWDYIAGNIISFVLSVLWSFYWNNRFVFTVENGKKRNFGKTLLKTYMAYGFTGIILNNVLSFIWIEKVGISKFIAPLINLIVSVPLNFVINKLWAFKSEDIN